MRVDRREPVGSPEDFVLDDSMGFLLYRAALMMKRELAREFRPYNITPEQWAVLNRLWHEDSLSQKELADRTYKDAPTMTRICRKLEDKRLIRREPCQADGRSVRLSLTDQARELMPGLVPRAVRSVETALEGISPPDATVTRRVLEQIFVNLT